MDPLPSARFERFESFREYEDRLDALIPRALETIRIFEPRLGKRYNTLARCELLREFVAASPARRLSIVVHDADALARDCPRLLRLAQDYQPRVQLRRTLRAAAHARDPVAIVDIAHYLHRFHETYMRAAQGLDDLEGAAPLIDRYGELWAASAAIAAGGPAGL
jgi:hypothetical protein